MDGDSTVSARDVKIEDGTPSMTDMAAASPHPATATASHDKTADTPYRSWKKKHQKMCIAFDEKMELNAKLHAQEVLAIQTSKRLAVEIDRILDLLLDVNNSPQIPGAKRIDLSLPLPASAKRPSLDLDQPGGWEKRFYDKDDPQAVAVLEPPAKALQTLLRDVRHVDLAAARQGMPALLRDLELGDDNRLAFVVPSDRHAPLQPLQLPPQQQAAPLYPESFLSADDVDNYLWEVDRTVAGRALLAGGPPPPMLPTLAPFAHALEMHASSSSAGTGVTGWEEFFNRSISNGDLPSMCSASASITTRDSILRNPTSVFNWLKKNAPRAVFLQEGEATAAAAADKENGHGHANGDEYHHYSYAGSGNAGGSQNGLGGTATGRQRKSVGAGRGGSRGRAKPLADTAAASDRYLSTTGNNGDADSDDLSFELATPRTMGAGAGRGGSKRKRPTQDDDVYRPKAGAAARGTKRKRKSEGSSVGEASVGAALAGRKTRKGGDGATTASEDVDMDAEAGVRVDGEEVEEAEDDEDGNVSVLEQEAALVVA